jgi:ABC-type nitrate/sulfonate/bicarbonate transport system permease component
MDKKKEELLDVHVAEASKFYKWYLNNERWILGLSSVLIFLGAWEAFSRSGVIKPLFISSPTAILKTCWDLFASGEIYNDLLVSGTEFFLGFILAVIISIPLGLIAGWYRKFFFVVDPFISALYATPRIALLPLIIIWLGIGIWSKVAIVFLGAFFPICVNTLSGVRTVDQELINAARSFGANDMRIFKTVVLPSSVPFILTGLRLGVGRALVGIVAGELYAATAGIGFLITVAGATFQTSKVFVGILIIAFFGILFVELLTRVERKFDKWRPPVGSAV